MKWHLQWLLFVAFCILEGCGQEKSSASRQLGVEKTSQPETDLVLIPEDSPKLSRIRIQVVEVAEVPLDEVVAPGKIEVNPNRVSRVTMPVPGRVRQVLVRLGDTVREGIPLLVIDSPEAGAALSAYRQAQAAVRRAQSNVSKAEADLSRIQDLFENRATAKKEVITAENVLAQARAEGEQAHASSDEALRRLEILGLKAGMESRYVEVRAPISGKVLEISVAPGEYRNDTAASLMTIADLSTVWMAADVPESLIRLVTRGERVEIELSAYPGEAFEARVTRIADMVDAQTRTVRVQAEMRNGSGRFLPEMFGRIRHSETFRKLPVVPVGAVIQGNGRTMVFVEKRPGAFQSVEVEAGRRHGDRLPILKGLKAGDRVVVDGAMLLRTS
jgi:cobalt-zinc-cadmium efflux system membrane fusion protein